MVVSKVTIKLYQVSPMVGLLNGIFTWIHSEKGASLLELSIMLGVMSVGGVLGMMQIEKTNTFVEKSRIDLDIKITDFKIKRLLSDMATCGSGLQNSSGNNMLSNIGTADVDVEQIIKHTEFNGVSTALDSNDRRHLRLSPPNIFDQGGNKLRIDSIKIKRLSASSSIVHLTVNYQWRLYDMGRDANTNEAVHQRISSRHHYFNVIGTGADISCESLSTEGLECKTKEALCEAMGVPKAIYVDSGVSGDCECITCSWGAMYGIDSELRPICINPADFTKRDKFKVKSDLGIIKRVSPLTLSNPHDNDFAFTFEKCPEGQVITGFQDVTKSIQCGPSGDLSGAPNLPCPDVAGEKHYFFSYYENNQLKVKCVPESYIPGQGCPDPNTIASFPQTVFDPQGVPCPGHLPAEHSYFYLEVDDNNCIERTINPTSALADPLTSNFILRSIKCSPANTFGHSFDCTSTDRIDVFTPCQN